MNKFTIASGCVFKSLCTSKSPVFVGLDFETTINTGLRVCKIIHSHNNKKILNGYLLQYIFSLFCFLRVNSRLFTTFTIFGCHLEARGLPKNITSTRRNTQMAKQM